MRLVSFLLYLTTSAVFGPSTANACGALFCQPQQPVVQAGESIAFGVEENDDGTTVNVTMVVQINYQGPSEEFAWILPVPAVPNVTVGSDIMFQALFDATRPSFQFTIDNSLTTTCTPEQLEETCDQLSFDSDGNFPTVGRDPEATEPPTAIVHQQGVAGPFNFATLEAADGRPESVLEWLENNGYDQPDGTDPLISYYAGMGMKFLALRLSKDSESGDIRPIVLDYQVEGNLDDTPVACVPIQLTALAATPDMPVQVYTLAPTRGVPLNYVHLHLDMRYLDWITCDGTFVEQNCYLNDYRVMFDASAQVADGHAFVTEFAGSADIAEGIIALDFDLQELSTAGTAFEFLSLLNDANVPPITLVHTIIERHIPNTIMDNGNILQACFRLPNIYTPGLIDECAPFIDFDGATFDPVELANELDEQVFQPALEAQEWLNRYDYLTRLYAQLDPGDMDKDPFFTFNNDQSDVSRFHEALGVPVCNVGGPIGLDISLENPPEAFLEEAIFVEASLSCGRWFRSPGSPVFVGMNPAYALSGFFLSGLESTTLFRDFDTGKFSSSDLVNLIKALDDSVPNQTVPGLDGWTPPTMPPTTAAPTSPPTGGARKTRNCVWFLGMSVLILHGMMML